MKMKLLLILLISALLAACGSSGNAEDSSAVDDTEDIKQLVEEYSGNTSVDGSASITSTELIINDEEEERVYNLPEDEFFVSIAPYINETHPCTNHSLTGCQGELAGEDFEIYMEDSDGNVVVDETMNAESNGFVDLWLPRNETFQVKISHDGKEVESEISTFEEDGTCVTTMQLM
ncbi:CueP family metal-binding protein [Virgibacillus sediminis]|uniref:CueP family metal-binding protein n=1 Tax=Virgibacillus sediminis TaxID=202260 RepID=A0ABV7A983_9BACI